MQGSGAKCVLRELLKRSEVGLIKLERNEKMKRILKEEWIVLGTCLNKLNAF